MTRDDATVIVDALIGWLEASDRKTQADAIRWLMYHAGLDACETAHRLAAAEADRDAARAALKGVCDLADDWMPKGPAWANAIDTARAALAPSGGG